MGRAGRDTQKAGLISSDSDTTHSFRLWAVRSEMRVRLSLFVGKEQQAVLLQGFLIAFGHLAIHAPRQDDNDATLASEQYLQHLFLHLRMKTADHSHFLPLANLRCPIQCGQYGERGDSHSHAASGESYPETVV